MITQRELINAAGMLHANPRFGRKGEPPLRGTVYCRGRCGREHVGYEVSAWHRSPKSRSDYILRIGGNLPGVMCRWWAEDDVAPGRDMEGTAGLDQQYIVEARFVGPDETKVWIHIYSMETMPSAARHGLKPLFI